MPMHPLKRALEYKGSNEFTRSELVGVLSFTLKLMDVRSAKELIERSIVDGIIEEVSGKLVINESLLEEREGEKDFLEEMVFYIAKSLGWEVEDVLEGIKAMHERYGNLDEKVLAYIFGMDKGVDMSRFRDKLEL